MLFRLASRQAHPDAGGDTATMVRVNEAAEVLRGCSGHVGPYQMPPGTGWRPYVADERLTFGKFRGRRLADVPLDYLVWMRQNHDSVAWRSAAAQVLDWRLAA